MEKIMKQLYRSISERKLLNTKYKIEKKYKINGAITLFLSISDDKDRAYVACGKGKTFLAAINEAIALFKKEKSKSFVPIYLKLDLVTKIFPWNEKSDKYYNLEEEITSYNRGIDGIAFDQNLDRVFTPQEVVAFNLVTNKKLNKSHLEIALDYKSPSFQMENINNLYKFRTITWYTNGEEVIRLKRGHRTFNYITKSDVWNAIKLTKNNYFKHVVNRQGKFVYSYFPAHNIKEKKYNILRHAGTIYSMLQTYELMSDEKLMRDIKKGLDFLKNKTKLAKGNNDLRMVVERDTTKLGGNALAIIAMSKYTHIADDKKYIPVMQELAAWIKEVQNSNGSFSVHKQSFSSGKVSDFISGFYTGQTILALCQLYLLDGNKEWIDVAEKAVDYMINIQNKNATKQTITHDHWLLYGLNALCHLNPKDTYINYMLLMSESIMDSQYLEDYSKKEWVGGFPPQSGKMPKSVPVACRIEGLSNVYEVAVKFGYKKKAEKLKKAIVLSTQFILQMQLREESVMHYQNKELSLGAFHNTFKTINLRNDFTQHNISACIACYNLLNEI